MKLGIYAIVLLVLATAAMASSDFKTECTNKGFDFSIAKYEKSGSSWNEVERNSLFSSYQFTVSGSLKDADWTADPSVAGVLVKGGTEYHPDVSGGTSGTAYCVNYTNPGGQYNCHAISHITFCGDYPPPPPCTGCNCPGANCNPVPEFSPITLFVAVAIAGLGLAYFRKH